MRLSDQVAQVRALLGDTDTIDPTYTDDQIVLNINTGCMKVAEETLCLQTYFDEVLQDWQDVTLTADDPRREGRYALQTDFLSLKDVEVFQSGLKYPLEARTFDQFKEETMVVIGGRPDRYKMELGSTDTSSGLPGDIWLHPRPNVNPATAPTAAMTLRTSYYQKPTRLVVGEMEATSELPEPFHMTVCFYAAMMLGMRDADFKRGDRIAQMYRDSLSSNQTLVTRSDRSHAQGFKPAYAPSKHWLRRRR